VLLNSDSPRRSTRVRRPIASFQCDRFAAEYCDIVVAPCDGRISSPLALLTISALTKNAGAFDSFLRVTAAVTHPSVCLSFPVTDNLAGFMLFRAVRSAQSTRDASKAFSFSGGPNSCSVLESQQTFSARRCWVRSRTVAENVAVPRFRALLLSLFAGLAVGLATAGAYSVMA
jgi:hypothetical protein